MELMKVFYDFEFKESYGHVDPISAGFVREDGKELYFVLSDFNTMDVVNDWWLMKNVMKYIGHESFTSHIAGLGTPVKDMKITDEAACTKQEARAKILDFVSDITPEWWAWYGAYDHVALCSLFGRMIDLPSNWPMYTCDLKQLHKQKGYCDMPRQDGDLHNALADARMNVVRYNHLLAQEDSNKYANKVVNPRPMKDIV